MSSGQRFSPELEALLREAGWFEGRNVAIRRFLDSISWLGGHPTALVRAFLTEFGGLVIAFPERPIGPLPERVDQMRLNPEFGDGFGADEYDRIIGEEVCPVGDVYAGHWVLMVGKSGALFGAFDDNVAEFGESPEAGMETIVHEREPLRMWGPLGS